MSSRAEFGGTLPAPVTVLQYRDISSLALHHVAQPSQTHFIKEEVEPVAPEAGSIGEPDLATQIAQARAEAARETEQRIRAEYEQKLVAMRSSIATALQKFGEERNEYYARLESEVVQLALAIAAKILHREAQVDPMLVAALVRIAIEKMHENSNVTVRVSPAQEQNWKRYFAGISMANVEVTGDPQLSQDDCVLATEMGSANFGLDAQLKEVEQGFFDLLALRPKVQ